VLRLEKYDKPAPALPYVKNNADKNKCKPFHFNQWIEGAHTAVKSTLFNSTLVAASGFWMHFHELIDFIDN